MKRGSECVWDAGVSVESKPGTDETSSANNEWNKASASQRHEDANLSACLKQKSNTISEGGREREKRKTVWESRGGEERKKRKWERMKNEHSGFRKKIDTREREEMKKKRWG